MQLYRRVRQSTPAHRRLRRSTPANVRDSRFLSSLCSCGYDIQKENDLHSLPKYQYPFINSSSSVRLFCLMPGLASDAIITGSITAVDLGNNHEVPLYFALSYAWVNSIRPHVINCGGFTISITCSLNSALRRLREIIHVPILIFADCICINQQMDAVAIQERSKQVQLMHRVFAQAAEVIADLGDEANNSSAALNWLQQLCSEPQKHWSTDPLCHILDAEGWDHLANFCERRWFTRLWVVQEVALATNMKFMLGKRFIPGPVIFGGIKIALMLLYSIWQRENGHAAATTLDRISNLREPISSLYSRFQGIESARTAARIELGKLLWVTRHFDVTDPHDRIYSILGLMSRTTAANFSVNYSEPLASLTAHLNQIVIDQGGLALSLSLLASYGESGVASWMFDLMELPRRASSHTWNISKEGSGCRFSACKAIWPVTRWCSGAPNILIVRGSNIGRLVAVSDALSTPDNNPIQLYYRIILWNRKLMKMAKDHTRNISHNDMQNLYIAAVVANGRIEGWAPEQLSACLQAASTMLNVDHGRWTLINAVKTWFRLRPDENPRFYEYLISYTASLRGFCHDRVVCITDRAQVGIMPKNARVGDELAIFTGCPEPFLIRKQEGTYKIVGPAYLHGSMDGEALESELWYEEDFYIS